MGAKNTRAGSYAWTSILRGRDVIQRGSRWRIGNGNSVKIWQHHWLPRKHPSKVSSPIVTSMEENTVASLIDPELRQWDHGLIDGIFAPQEAEIIKKIPLSHKESEDILYWPFTYDGHYTCKSGYHFLKAKAALAPIEIEPNRDKELWRGVWSLQVPNKVKNML